MAAFLQLAKPRKVGENHNYSQTQHWGQDLWNLLLIVSDSLNRFAEGSRIGCIHVQIHWFTWPTTVAMKYFASTARRIHKIKSELNNYRSRAERLELNLCARKVVSKMSLIAISHFLLLQSLVWITKQYLIMQSPIQTNVPWSMAVLMIVRAKTLDITSLIDSLGFVNSIAARWDSFSNALSWSVNIVWKDVWQRGEMRQRVINSISPWAVIGRANKIRGEFATGVT